MVTIIDYRIATNNSGEQFVALELQGDLEMVQSNESGRYYATARRCSIASTFKEVMAKQMIGKTLPGIIEKMSCDAYDFTIEETGEVIQLAFTYNYNPDGADTSTAKTIIDDVFSKNGVGSLA